MACLLCGTVAGQQRARCSLSDPAPFEGQPVLYEVLIRRVSGEVELKEDPEVEGLTFERLRAGVRSQGTIIVNGRVSRHADWAATWRVVGERRGSYTIPMPRLTADDDVVPGHPVTLKIRPAAQQEDVRVEFQASATDVVLGQAVELTADVFLKHLPPPSQSRDPLTFHDQFPRQMSPPELSLPWLPAPPFGTSGFDANAWMKSVMSEGRGLRLPRVNRLRFTGQVSDVQLPAADGEQAAYRRYRFSVNLRADQLGTFELGSAAVEGSIAFKTPRGFVKESRFVRSKPVTVTISEPPATGRPAGFTGAVGRFALTAQPPTPTSVVVGAPVYFTVVVSGNGFLDGVEMDLATQLKDGWQVDPPTITDSLPPGAERPRGFPDRPGKWRQFEYKLRPSREDISAVPPVSFAYFDVEAGDYRTLETPPFPLEVRPVGARTGSGVLDATGGAPTTGELVRAGLSANEDDLNKLGNQQTSPWGFLIIGGCLLPLWFLTGAWIRRRQELAADPALGRRRAAPGRAARRLKEAMALQGPDSLTAAVAALCGFVGDLEDRPEEAVTSGDLRRLAAASGLPEDDLQGLEELLEAGEAASFGAGALDEVSRARLFAAAEAFLGAASSTSASKVVGLSVLLLACCAVSAPGQDTGLFQQAQAAFSEGRFEDAARAYEAMLSDDYANGHVLYNMGNAWVRAGSLGRAVGAYRRALWYLPGDANVARNLGEALKQKRQDLSADEEPVVEKIFFWRTRTTFFAQALTAVVLGALACVCSLVRRLRRSVGAVPRVASWVGLGVALLFATSAWMTWEEQSSGDHGAVIQDDTRLLQWPATDAETSYEQPLHDGDEFVVVQRRDGWLKVRAADRYEGWIPGDRAVTW